MVEVFEVFLEEGDGIETGWFITVLVLCAMAERTVAVEG